MGLTPKERVIAQIEHKETDYIPYTITFEEGVPEELDDYYGSDTWRILVDNAIRNVPLPNRYFNEYPRGQVYWTDLYGTVWQVDHRPVHIAEPVIKSPSLDGFELPSVDTLFDNDWEEKTLQVIDEQTDFFLVFHCGFGLFERTWALRGFTETLMDVAANPGFFTDLVELVADHQIEIIDRALELPIDGVFLGDDWSYQQGVMIGAERWRKTIKPHLARMYSSVHKAGKYMLNHACGSVEEILPDLIEIGLDVYESVQPEAKNNNPYDLKRKYGNEITFWGGLGSQSTIPFGTPQEIREEVVRLCREMGKGGGYILSPAKPLQPGTPVHNAAAVVEAFLEQAGVSLSASQDLGNSSDTVTTGRLL